MVKALIDINQHANRVLKIVKAKWDLKDKSEAINLVTEMFEEDILEPQLKPEFLEKLKMAEKKKGIKVENIDKFLGLE